MNVLELFAGAGGGILGSMLNGHRTVCAVEYNAYARSVLLARQNDGTFPPFPVWDDVRTFDGKPWRGIVDVVSGGFPCQDISVAGRGVGITGERSGLWAEMARIIREVRPRYAYIENSPALLTRGIDVVLAELHEMGFDAEWGIVSAADCGANHRRERIWILAYSDSVRKLQPKGREQDKRGWAGDGGESVAYTMRPRLQGDRTQPPGQDGKQSGGEFAAGCWWSTEPAVGRVAHGVAHRVDRLKAIGNGQVPRVAATAWDILINQRG